MTSPAVGGPRSILLIAAMSLVACGGDAPRTLLSGAPPPPPDIREACELATRRCSRCHPIERVMMSRGIGPGRWAMYVEQMRLKPSSGISREDAATIFRCLTFVDSAGRS